MNAKNRKSTKKNNKKHWLSYVLAIPEYGGLLASLILILPGAIFLAISYPLMSLLLLPFIQDEEVALKVLQVLIFILCIPTVILTHRWLEYIEEETRVQITLPYIGTPVKWILLPVAYPFNVVYNSYKKFKNDLGRKLQKTLSKDPDNAVVNRDYANYLGYQKGDIENAEIYYKKSFSLDPKDAVFHENYASFLSRVKGDHESAESHFLKAIDLEPNNPDFNRFYADFLDKAKKDLDKAESYYLQTISLNSNDWINIVHYANFLSNSRKDYKAADDIFQDAITISPEDPDLNGVYACFLNYKLKDFDKAEKYYLNALHFDHEHVKNLGNYARFLYLVRRDFKNAKNALMKAHSIDPKYPGSFVNYSQLLLILEKYKRASKTIEKAIRLNDGNKSEPLLELMFFRYAFYNKAYPKSEIILQELLDEGIRIVYNDFDELASKAILRGHPVPDKIEYFSKVIFS